MSFSIGEVSDLCIKATRGAGRSWGVAEEAGWAIRWLARAGLPGPERLARLLGGAEGTCPLTLGARLSDTGKPALLERAGAIAEPLLLMPFLSRLAPPGRALQVTIGGRPARIWSDGTDLGEDITSVGYIGVSGDVPAPPCHPPCTRVAEILPEAFAVLSDLAARTYAPATEASRLRGAGAGVSDND